MTSSFAGTPSYMAPEQANGGVESLDRRTDVYALGATLYELLAGRPPFNGANVLAVVRQLLYEEPPPLQKVRPDVPKDLEAIVMRCLEKEQGRRYESAKALGEDLQRFLDGTPVLARRASLGYVLLKAAKKHKMRVALEAALLVVMSVFGALWLRERHAMAEQAALSRELGEDVKEMELFLSRAYGLPLHDIERERSIVRRRLLDIEARMAPSAGPEKGRGTTRSGGVSSCSTSPKKRALTCAGPRPPGMRRRSSVMPWASPSWSSTGRRSKRRSGSRTRRARRRRSKRSTPNTRRPPSPTCARRSGRGSRRPRTWRGSSRFTRAATTSRAKRRVKRSCNRPGFTKRRSSKATRTSRRESASGETPRSISTG